MRPIVFFVAASLVACACAAESAPAARPATPSRPLFRTAIDAVPLAVTVSRAGGGYIGHLSASDFEVYDNGRLQHISTFVRGTGPLDVALLIDVSASVFDHFDLVRAAAKGFVDALQADDRAAVIGFHRQLRLMADWTSDHRTLARALDEAYPGGSTSLYTALYVAITGFEPAPTGDPSPRRRAVIVLTDGRDTNSLLSYEDVIEACRRSAVAIYTIRVKGRGPSAIGRLFGRRPDRTPEYVLTNVARESGGRAFAIGGLGELSHVYLDIATELSNQYLLGFVPSVSNNRSPFHSVTVAVPHVAGAFARTRLGYLSDDRTLGATSMTSLTAP